MTDIALRTLFFLFGALFFVLTLPLGYIFWDVDFGLYPTQFFDEYVQILAPQARGEGHCSKMYYALWLDTRRGYGKYCDDVTNFFDLMTLSA